MVSANNAELRRAFVTPTGGAVEEKAISSTVTTNLLVDVEAGSVIFTSVTPPFKIIGVVTDLNTETVVGTGTVTGTVGAAPWGAAASTITVISGLAGLVADHVFQATIAMQVGVGSNPIADLAEVLFLITS